MRFLNARALTLRYGAALGLVGLCTLTSHLILTRVLYEHQGSAYLINISGRQRMLSQRIAGLAAQRALGDAGVEGDLASTIDLFEANFRKLRLDRRSAILEAIYEGQGLSADVQAYVSRARRFLATDVDDPGLTDQAMGVFAASRSSLIRKLDAVVGIYQGESERNLARLQKLQAASLVVILATLLFEALGVFRPMVNNVVRYASELLRLSRTDELTQLHNRRAFFEEAEIAVEAARRSGRHLSVLMIDIDHFKRVNDLHGHPSGDAVLSSFAGQIRKLLRAAATFGRLGGEEFAVLLPDVDDDEAFEIAEDIRRSVALTPIALGSGMIRVTISVGLAAFHTDLADANALLGLADKALYLAKSGGRDRVISAGRCAEELIGRQPSKVRRSDNERDEHPSGSTASADASGDH